MAYTTIPAKIVTYYDYEHVKKAATFPVKVPTKIPMGFKLVAIHHIRPDIDVPDFAKNDVVLAIYSDGQNQLSIRQGHFSGGNVPKSILGTPLSEIEIQGARGRWVQGATMLIVGWDKDQIGYRVESTKNNLNELVEIANSLA